MRNHTKEIYFKILLRNDQFKIFILKYVLQLHIKAFLVQMSHDTHLRKVKLSDLCPLPRKKITSETETMVL